MTGQPALGAVPASGVRTGRHGERQRTVRRPIGRWLQVRQRYITQACQLLQRIAQAGLALVDGHAHRGESLEVLDLRETLLDGGARISHRDVVLEVEPLPM